MLQRAHSRRLLDGLAGSPVIEAGRRRYLLVLGSMGCSWVVGWGGSGCRCCPGL